MDQVIAERYALGPLVGVGGMARVYAADDQRLHRRVAIKLVPLAAAEPVARQRFVREARSAAGFAHPNSVAIYDAGEADGYLYLVMEMVKGRTLADRLAEQGALQPTEATAIANSVLNALAAAHAVGIVHRDVKPANILLGQDGSVKLADFGIAKRLDDVGDATIAGEIMGTPKYLAPEQISGHAATPTSDVYALGVVLYEMLAGQPPFDADTPLATALAHRDAPVPNLAQLRPGLPNRLVHVVHTAMAKDPADRFDSAHTMREALMFGVPDPTAVHPSHGTVQPTQVMTTAGNKDRSWTPAWAGLVALLAIAGVAVAAVVVTNDDPNDATGVTSNAPSVPAATTIITTTTTITTTTDVATTTAPTTLATTVPAPSFDLGTIDGIIATLEANPDQFGSAAGDVVKELGKIGGNGQSAERRAAELLEQAAEWVDNGELDPAVLAMLEPVLGPIAGSGDNEEDDD